MSRSGVLYEHIALVDSSAVIALLNENDRFHQEATDFFTEAAETLAWSALDVTAHESFTRVRYHRHLLAALEHYDFLRCPDYEVLRFTSEDEDEARALLAKYDDQVLSYHDALCAAVMLRIGIFKIFTFDRDFWTPGFQVLPGITA